MTEVTPDYLEAVSVKCPKCGVVIGKYKSMPQGQTWLKDNTGVWSEKHGYCICGAEYHWVYTTKRLEDLIERIKK